MPDSHHHLAGTPQRGKLVHEAPAANAGVEAQFLPPDRSHELADRSYRMVDYTWFRIPGRVPELPAPHYVGHGFAYSPNYNIKSVWQAPMHDHVVVKVSLSQGGVIAPSAGAAPRRLRPGEAILRFVEESELWESFDARQRKPWEFLGLILNGNAAAVMAQGLIGQFGHTYELGQGHRLIARLMEMSNDPSHVKEMSGTEALHLCNSVFDALYEAADVSANRFKSVELAEAAEAAIRDELGRDWTVLKLAAKFDVSREHLTRAFTERHGVPPHRYIIELRVQEACRRLRTTTDPVKAIFLDLGFKSHTSFSRAFQRYHQVTPSEYREMRS